MGWPLTERDLKHYPHFDKAIPLEELSRVATSPAVVAATAFWPFLLYKKQWTRFREAGQPKKTKTREIRYAARRDSAIYSYYRAILQNHYESELERRGLAGCVLAYRRIKSADGHSGKTNINFAHDAFQKIREQKDCCAVALDIKGYFDNMDHELLQKQWCQLLGLTELPPDHRRVFKSVTRYACVERDEAYERLGYLKIERKPGGEVRKESLVKSKDIPMQICSTKNFTAKIKGKEAGLPSLIQVNDKGYGIPQGSPISDVLANLYLIDFDVEMNAYATALGGSYFRYSDDILLIVPGSEADGKAAEAYASTAIMKYGDQIRIKADKTDVVIFSTDPNGTQVAKSICHAKNSGGLEYLGFRFDGSKAYIRNGTLSGVLRKMKRTIRREVRALVARYNGKDRRFLQSKLAIRELEQRFWRVKGFDRKASKRSWTFYTYVRRADFVFGPKGQQFFRQVRRTSRLLQGMALEELEREIASRAPQVIATS